MSRRLAGTRVLLLMLLVSPFSSLAEGLRVQVSLTPELAAIGDREAYTPKGLGSIELAVAELGAALSRPEPWNTCAKTDAQGARWLETTEVEITDDSASADVRIAITGRGFTAQPVKLTVWLRLDAGGKQHVVAGAPCSYQGEAAEQWSQALERAATAALSWSARVVSQPAR